MPQMHRCYHHDCRKLISVRQRYCDEHVIDDDRKSIDKSYYYNRKRDEASQEQLKFYKGKAWRSLRKDVLNRDMNLCQYCQLNDRVTVADMVDHIVPREIAESLELDMDNLVSSCNGCHRLKQDWEQKHYGTGKRNKIDSNALWVTDISFIKDVFKR